MPEIKIQDTTYNLYEGITVLGRGDDADITIDSPKLSRTHVRFTVDGDTIYIEDLGSKNGTFLNGGKLSSKKEVTANDNIRLGDMACVIISGKKDVSSTSGSTAPVKPKSRPVRPVPAASEASSDLHLVRNLVFAGVIILIFSIIWLSLGREKKISAADPHILIEKARTVMEVVHVTQDTTLNEQWMEKLGKLREEISSVPADDPAVYEECQSLILDINILTGKLKDSLRTGDPEKEAEQAYNNAIQGISSGLSADELINRLKTVVMLYPGTKGAGLAQEKIFELEKAAGRAK